MKFRSDDAIIHSVFGSLSDYFKILSVYSANGTVKYFYTTTQYIQVDSLGLYDNSAV